MEIEEVRAIARAVIDFGDGIDAQAFRSQDGTYAATNAIASGANPLQRWRDLINGCSSGRLETRLEPDETGDMSVRQIIDAIFERVMLDAADKMTPIIIETCRNYDVDRGQVLTVERNGKRIIDHLSKKAMQAAIGLQMDVLTENQREVLRAIYGDSLPEMALPVLFRVIYRMEDVMQENLECEEVH